MRISTLVKCLPSALFAFAISTPLLHAQTPDYASIQSALKASGVIESDGVLHFDLVRSDLSMTVGTQAVNSGVVANGYVNFKSLGSTWFVDGSLPAQETEASAVQVALRVGHNIDVTAVVNQIALESPRLLSIHFEATGNGTILATEIASALAKMASPQIGVTSAPVPLSIIPNAAFENAFIAANGTAVVLNNNVYVFSVPRDDIQNYLLGTVPASQSLGVAYNFYVQILPTGENILIYTDLSVSQLESQHMQNALVRSGLSVVGLHDNFEDDSQRIYNLNGFGVGNAGTIGNALFTSLNAVLNSFD